MCMSISSERIFLSHTPQRNARAAPIHQSLRLKQQRYLDSSWYINHSPNEYPAMVIHFAPRFTSSKTLTFKLPLILRKHSLKPLCMEMSLPSEPGRSDSETGTSRRSTLQAIDDSFFMSVPEIATIEWVSDSAAIKSSSLANTEDSTDDPTTERCHSQRGMSPPLPPVLNLFGFSKNSQAVN
jgi:hypothetical protein